MGRDGFCLAIAFFHAFLIPLVAGQIGVLCITHIFCNNIVDIVKALKGIEPAAAEKFVELYLGELIKDEDEPLL